MCISSNSVNQAQDLMSVTKIEDFPNSLIPTEHPVPCPSVYLLTDEENGRHPPERVVAHGSEGPAGAAARPARVVQTRQLLLHEGCSREQASKKYFLFVSYKNPPKKTMEDPLYKAVYNGVLPAAAHLLPV